MMKQNKVDQTLLDQEESECLRCRLRLDSNSALTSKQTRTGTPCWKCHAAAPNHPLGTYRTDYWYTSIDWTLFSAHILSFFRSRADTYLVTLAMNKGPATSIVVLNSLMTTCRDGPAVSLNGSPAKHWEAKGERFMKVLGIGGWKDQTNPSREQRLSESC